MFIQPIPNGDYTDRSFSSSGSPVSYTVEDLGVEIACSASDGCVADEEVCEALGVELSGGECGQ